MKLWTTEDGRTDDGRTPEHGYTYKLTCEPSAQVSAKNTLKNLGRGGGAVLMTNDPKWFIALTANSCKSAFGIRTCTSRQKELACTELCFCLSDESFCNPEIGNNVQVMMIRLDCYLCSKSILRLEF